jgi:hypothetical protein
MTETRKFSRWLSYAIVALAISMLGAALMTAFECKVGTTDQCLMSQGFFLFYWGGLFVLLWPIVAIVGAAQKARRERAED